MAKRKKKETQAAEPLAEANEAVQRDDFPHEGPSPSESPAVHEETPPAEQDAPQEDWASRTQRDPAFKDEPDRPSSYPDPNVPFSIAHDNQAGVRLLKSERFKQVQLAFSSAVSGDIEGQLVAAGWRYRPEEKVYTKQYGESGAGASMVEAKRLYDEIVKNLLEEKGLTRSNTR